MDKEIKFLSCEVKEGDDGTFTGNLSTFGNIDNGGDIVEQGAFKKTLLEHMAFPLCWSHKTDLPNIIATFHGQETEKALAIAGSFLPDEDGQKARAKIRTLRDRGVKVGLSIGYRAVKPIFETVEGQLIRRIKEAKLFEGSGTLFPMNELARFTNVKGAALEELEEDEEVVEAKPYPNEHACRLLDPGQFVRYFRKKVKDSNTPEGTNYKPTGKAYILLIGYRKDESSAVQAQHYPKDTWSAEEARAHCKAHKGTFEAATGKALTLVCGSCGETLVLGEPAEATRPGVEPSKSEPGEFHSALQKIADSFKSTGR